MSQAISIAGRKICDECPPYVIAEMSANHNGSIENAFKIIEKAKVAGADAVKIQTYSPSTITLNSELPDFQIKDGLWRGRTLYELYDWAHTPWEWHAELFNKSRELGITMFSSPFDRTAVDLLEDLNTPAYKIASFEAVDLPLIEYVASTGKPLIISTGMANAEEIQEAVDAALANGCTELALLHCVSAYPAAAADYNLATIKDMSERYRKLIGLSDHTGEHTTAIAAVALGALIIEKHVTLDKNAGGPDDSFSINPYELEELIENVNLAWAAKGNVNYKRKSGEKENLIFRRSLYFSSDVSKGTVLTDEHVRSVRPGYGLAPKFYKQVIGKRLRRTVVAGSRVEWELLDG